MRFTKVGKSLADLDEFTQRRFEDIATRWLDAKRAHQRTERLLWLGTIAAEFADDDYADTYFSVSPADSVASGLSAFDADGGYNV